MPFILQTGKDSLSPYLPEKRGTSWHAQYYSVMQDMMADMAKVNIRTDFFWMWMPDSIVPPFVPCSKAMGCNKHLYQQKKWNGKWQCNPWRIIISGTILHRMDKCMNGQFQNCFESLWYNSQELGIMELYCFSVMLLRICARNRKV